jgi:hypothetical protein
MNSTKLQTALSVAANPTADPLEALILASLVELSAGMWSSSLLGCCIMVNHAAKMLS